MKEEFVPPVCGEDGQMCLSCCRVLSSCRVLQLLSLRPGCRHEAKFSAATVTSDQLALRPHWLSAGGSNTQVALVREPAASRTSASSSDWSSTDRH